MSPGAVRGRGAGGERTRAFGPNNADQSKGAPTPQDGPERGEE